MAKNTAPDVCKTPSPGGPVPIPYPVIMSKSSDLKNGTTTVKADGGKMIAVKGCEYATCNGDEAGTAGGVVSSTNMKEAKFILFSFDVKMDGKNACRLSDKMTMNHQNTICMLGSDDETVETEPFTVNVDCKTKREDKPDKGKSRGRGACASNCAPTHQENGGRTPAGKIQAVPGAREKPDYSSRTRRTYIENFMDKVRAGEDVDDQFVHPCAACEYNKMPKGTNPTEEKALVGRIPPSTRTTRTRPPGAETCRT